jgi:transmembrane sensor
MKTNEAGIDFEIIWRKLHTSISPVEEEVLRSWLEEDPRHQKFFNNVSRYYREGTDPDHDPGRTLKSWKRVAGEIDARPKIKRKRRSAAITAAVVIAAGITILVSILMLKPGEREEPVYSVMDSRIEPGSSQAVLILDDGSVHDLTSETNLEIEEGGARINNTGDALEYVEKPAPTTELKFNTLSIPRGGEFYLTLSDGTRVWLNSETILKYPVRFPEEESRTVELDGEAYFEVARDEVRPFRVITGEQELEVLGTSFNLSSYGDEAFVYTTLVEGRVRVFARENPDIERILKPSQQSRFERGTGSISLEKVDVREFIAWKDGIFSFSNQDLSEMMKTVSRWYDLEVEFERPGAEQIKFTGEVRRYENFEKILALIEKTNEVRFEIDGRIVFVK